jgi:hypothetical protein
MTDEEKCKIPPGIYCARILSIESDYREALHDKEFEEVEKIEEIEEIEEIIEPAGLYFQLTLALSRPDDPEEYIWSSAEDSLFALTELCSGFGLDHGGFSLFLRSFGLSQEEVLDRNLERLIGKVAEVPVIACCHCMLGPSKTEVPSRSLIFDRAAYFPL